MAHFNINDRVQLNRLENKFDTNVKCGKIINLIYSVYISAKNLNNNFKENYYAKIKWDDGTESTIPVWDLVPEDSLIEREFRLHALPIMEKISKKLEEAQSILNEVEKIAKENNISFHSPISPLAQSYHVKNFKEKWPNLSNEFLESITGVYVNENRWSYGWERSAIC